jgi:hypothetical protein
VALRSAVDAYPAPAPSVSPTPERSGASSRPELLAAEQAAARDAAAESAALRGADAALLASISAAESTHAELLS